MEVTHTLARYLVQSRAADLPAAVRHEAARALVNFMGCAIGASHHETTARAVTAFAPFSGPPQATLFGRAERVDILNASLVNGISAHVLDFDDTHARAIHPSAPVWPALLACAEWRTVTGAELVHAFVLGVEAEERVGLSVFPEHYQAGWHITGTAGVFGAAAGAGRLLGLDEQRMTWALGIAASQAAGLQAMFGSDCKSLHPGRAAHGGLTAALLAARGFTSSGRAIEAPRGYGHVLSTKFDPAVITEGLGERYELLSNMYKPYACGLVVHAAIDGCIEIFREHALRPEDVETVELTVSPLVPRLTGNPLPTTGLEGKFSVFHAVAAAMIHGAAGEAQFSDECVRNPRVAALRGRVRLQVDESIGRTEARVTIATRDGRTLARHVEHALGTLARPMSDADLENKFRALAAGILPDRQIRDVLDACWGIWAAPDGGAVARAAAARAD